jgi:hypothetical protein
MSRRLVPSTVRLVQNNRTLAVFPMTASDEDWIRAGRLRVAAAAGDADAAAKLAAMEAEPMYREEEVTDA